jgi:uncharacterized protein YcnI
MSPSIRTRSPVALACGASLVFAVVTPVTAHVEIPDGEAVPAGASAEIHLHVPHGCEGQATDTVEVQLPDGIVSAQPAYVPGWTVEVEMVESEPYERFGETLTERVGVIRWSGGDLPDFAYYDFGVRATFLLDAGTVLPIPVVQRCADAETAWIEVPAEGESEDDLEHPAPTITVVEAETE